MVRYKILAEALMIPHMGPPQQAPQKNEFRFFLVFCKWIFEKKLESTSIFRNFIAWFVSRFFQDKKKHKSRLDLDLLFFWLVFFLFFP